MLAVRADIGVRQELDRFAHEALSQLEGCDILIHNAASGGPGQLFEMADDEFEADFASAFAVNLMAPARLARKAADALVASGGVMVNISSAWSRQVMDITPASYGATKAGLNHLTVTLARDLGPRGVRVVGVAPGPIWTPLNPCGGQPPENMDDFGEDTPMGRPGEPNEVAPAFLFLACDDSSYMSGQVLHPNGGIVVNG